MQNDLCCSGPTHWLKNRTLNPFAEYITVNKMYTHLVSHGAITFLDKISPKQFVAVCREMKLTKKLFRITTLAKTNCEIIRKFGSVIKGGNISLYRLSFWQHIELFLARPHGRNQPITWVKSSCRTFSLGRHHSLQWMELLRADNIL